MAISTAETLNLPQMQNAGAPVLAGGGAAAMQSLPDARGAAAASLPASSTVAAGLQDVLQQPAVRKAFPAIMALIALVILGGVYVWVQETPYRAIFPGMAEVDQHTAFEHLKAANLSPRIDASTGNLTVPATRFHEARILLASQGLPRNQNRGVLESLKDQTAMTTSQFMEQARYSAAIEQELAKSIGQIDSIQSVRVHLAQARQSAFIRDRVPAKASVVVTPYGGRLIGTGQVQAIIHLVASSVPYLSAEDVSVVDNLGNLLTKSPVDTALGLTGAQMQIKQQSEENYRNRIVQLLEPIVGEGNVRAQVDLSMNFSQVETTSEDFDATRQGPKTRSEQLSEERIAKSDATGVPGALSNTPPPQPEAKTDISATDEKTREGSGTLSSKSTRNYEIDKVVRHVKSPMGGIDRVTVAVVIKEREPAPKGKDAKDSKDASAQPEKTGFTPEELERLNAVVKGAVGFKEDRGDVVSILPAKFEAPSKSGSDIAWYENEMATSIMKVGLAALVLIVVLLTVVRPVVKSYLPEPPAPLQLSAPADAAAGGDAAASGAVAAADGDAEAGGGADGENADGKGADALVMEEGESIDDFRERLKKSAAPKKSSISADMLDTANTYDDKVALIRLLVAEDSGRVANVLKTMIRLDNPV
jgi:flagellar M-ring protein FliF